MNIEQLKPLLVLIHEKFYSNETFEYYMSNVVNKDLKRHLIFKNGYNIMKTDDFEIEPTLYEVYLNLNTLEITFELGNLEVATEKYFYADLLKMFKVNNIGILKEPNPIDIIKYLKTYRLLSPHISIGTNAEIDKVMQRIQSGKDMQGQYYQKEHNEYIFLDIQTTGKETSIKKITCPSTDHLVYALSGGGNLGNESIDMNEVVFNTIKKRIVTLTEHFNKEVLMTLLCMETGIEDYEELTQKLNSLSS